MRLGLDFVSETQRKSLSFTSSPSMTRSLRSVTALLAQDSREEPLIWPRTFGTGAVHLANDNGRWCEASIREDGCLNVDL